MASLFSLQVGEFDEFKRILAGKVSAEDARKISKNPKVLEAMEKAMREHEAFRLRHGLWTSLAEVIETTKAWPGLLDRFGEKGFALALEEFNDSPRRKRFEAEQEKSPLVQAVVVPYLGSVPETFLYARARMMNAFGKDYDEWKEAYAHGVDDQRVQLLPEATNRTECIRIEVVDFGAHVNSKDGFVPKDVRGKDSAHAAVIYAASQNIAWVRQMDGSKVPYALAGGYRLNVPSHREWTDLPSVWRLGDQARLNGDWYDDRYHTHTLPVLWE